MTTETIIRHEVEVPITGGEVLTVRELNFFQTAKVAPHLAAAINAAQQAAEGKDEISITELIAKIVSTCAVDVAAIIAISVGKTTDEIGAMRPVDVLNLGQAVFLANADFFDHAASEL